MTWFYNILYGNQPWCCNGTIPCGYIGETWGWHYGFGLAGFGMLAGVIVFWDGLRKNVFGDKGLQPTEYIEKKFSTSISTN